MVVNDRMRPPKLGVRDNFKLTHGGRFGAAALIFTALAGLFSTPHCEAAKPAPGALVARDVVVKASLRGVSVFDAKTIWASGAKGTILRSVDAGRSFQVLKSPAGKEVDYRDVHAFSSQRASLLTAGQPVRMYHTDDGGETWSLAYECKQSGAFLNAMDFWDDRNGIAFSDAIDGRLLIIRTRDGGRTWSENPVGERPKIDDAEHGYAASGSCLAVGKEGRVWIGLSGAPKGSRHARVLHSIDYGKHWQPSNSCLVGSESAGIFSLVNVARTLVAVGGDYKKEDSASSVLALSNDLGHSWATPKEHGLRGYRSSVANARLRKHLLVAVGPSGADYSENAGVSWRALGGNGYHAVDFSRDGASGWAVGADGRMAEWQWARERIDHDLNQKVTIEFDETTLSEAIDQLVHKSGVPIVIDSDLVDDNPSMTGPFVSEKFNDAPLNEVLRKVTAGVGFTFAIMDGVVVIIRSN